MVRSYEEFTQEVADVTASGIQKVLTVEIVKALEPKLVGTQLLAPDTKLVGTGGTTRTFRKRTAVEAATFLEGENVPQVSPDITYSTQDVTPTSFGASEIIYGDALDAADFNIINDTKISIADAMARKSDERIWEKLANLTTVTDEATTPGTGNGTLQWFELGNDKVISVTNVKVGGVTKAIGIDYKVDYFKGWIFFEVAPTAAQGAITASYKYSTRNAVDAGVSLSAPTVGQLNYNDLVDAKAKITSLYGRADTVVVYTDEESDLLKDDKFIDASKYGGREPLLNGEIGQITGLKVLTSQKMYQGVGAVLQKGNELGYLVYKAKLQAKTEKLQKKANDIQISVWEKSLPGIVNSDLICIILNAQQYAKRK